MAVTGRIALVVGARPNYFKARPILARLDRNPELEPALVHTGQHHDPALFEDLFRQLDMRAPDAFLGVPERDRRLSVPEMTSVFHAWCLSERPAAVVVVGDVDSTLAAALGAYHAGVPVAHVEAGLRSFDRAMPEEINRIVTDAVSGLLLVSDPAGAENLAREGRSPEDVRLVGNVMIDTLLERLEAARGAPLPSEVAAATAGGDYALLTLHRPSNVDDPARLAAWTDALRGVAARLPVVFPVHPRTRRSLEAHGLWASLAAAPGMTLTPPLGYLELVRLQEGARLVMTDSGGISEEASVLGVPCLTLRSTTERPITVSHGTAVLVGEDPTALAGWVDRVLSGAFAKEGRIPLWDGRAAERVEAELLRFLAR